VKIVVGSVGTHIFSKYLREKEREREREKEISNKENYLVF